MRADGFCTRKFFATEASMLCAIFAYNLLAVHQAQVTPESDWWQPSKTRAAVFICGAAPGRMGRKVALGLATRRKSREASIAPLLVQQRGRGPFWEIMASAGARFDPGSTAIIQMAKLRSD